MTKIPMWKATISSMLTSWKTNLPKRNPILNFAWLYPAFLGAAMLFSIGCSENLPGPLGEDVLPSEDTLGVVNVDTFRVILESRIRDEVKTGNANLALLGNYIDPELGRISTTTYSKLSLPGVEVEFGEQLEFESVTLNLRFISFYGNVSTPQKLEVYNLQGSLPDSLDDLKSNSPAPALDADNLAGSFTIDFSETGSVGDISVPLDASIGEYLLNTPVDNLLNNEVFRQYMKGLAFTTTPVGFSDSREPGAVFYLDLGSTESFVELSYSRFDAGTNERVEETFNFRFDGDNNAYHRIERSDFQNVRMLGIDGILDDNMYEFIQSGALIETFLDIPGINDLEQVAINRGTITLKVDDEFLGGGNRFQPPSAILAYLADEDRNYERDEEGRVTLFGVFNYNTTEGGYVIDMAGHVQQVASQNRENHGFILVPEDSSFTLNRAVLIGTEHPTEAPKFNLTYTKLP